MKLMKFIVAAAMLLGCVEEKFTYTVQLSTTPGFENYTMNGYGMFYERSGLTDTSFELPSYLILPDRFYWRVAAVGRKTGQQGGWSPAREVTASPERLLRFH